MIWRAWWGDRNGNLSPHHASDILAVMFFVFTVIAQLCLFRSWPSRLPSSFGDRSSQFLPNAVVQFPLPHTPSVDRWKSAEWPENHTFSNRATWMIGWSTSENESMSASLHQKLLKNVSTNRMCVRPNLTTRMSWESETNSLWCRLPSRGRGTSERLSTSATLWPTSQPREIWPLGVRNLRWSSRPINVYTIAYWSNKIRLHGARANTVYCEWTTSHRTINLWRAHIKPDVESGAASSWIYSRATVFQCSCTRQNLMSEMGKIPIYYQQLRNSWKFRNSRRKARNWPIFLELTDGIVFDSYNCRPWRILVSTKIVKHLVETWDCTVWKTSYQLWIC